MENEKENFHQGAICWSGKRKKKHKRCNAVKWNCMWYFIIKEIGFVIWVFTILDWIFK